MKYNLHNTWKGNAPPNTRQKLRPIKSVEIPIEASGAKGKRQKAKSLQLAACGSETFYFELFTFPLIFKGSPLLNMRDGFTRHAQQDGFIRHAQQDGFTRHAQRDGPRGRAPANSLALANGLVTLNQKTSVSLCGCSVNSVVKKLKPQRKPGSHREHREITNKGIPPILHGLCPNAGGKANDGRVEYLNSRIFECQAVILSVPEV
ncbi:hypothetical protein [Draconibacterium orientale]|uniref:hypothetical protein n=1 Tax=Draconibacterium orientale TaxID=1168034 RepID=UPI0029BFC945|nr:hypothetical protein [Draconibacterium orientale]